MIWQLIKENAPSDTFILVTAKGEIATTAQYKAQYKHWSLAETGGYAEDSDLSYEPTHWMPIPELT